MRLREAVELIMGYFEGARIEVIKHVARRGEECFRLMARLNEHFSAFIRIRGLAFIPVIA